jgi:aminomuconate-semialdehyde/2-hydroxymuconate-6-semialdehyde dehydrogenase
VAAVVTPWNAPLSLATSGAAAALACGNTCVLKPSELAPVTTSELAKIFDALELPPGVLNVVHGPGQPTGEALAVHPEVNAIAFTGGTATGRRIMEGASRTLKRFVGELGGNAPTLVFADADLDRAIDGTLLCAFANNGEACVAGSRILVERPLYDAFVERFVARAAAIRVGDPLEPTTEVGPIIAPRHLERLQGLIRGAVAEGATVRCGGGRPPGLDRGYYLQPTVLTGARPGSAVLRDEVLGPVVTITPFQDEAEGLAMANDTPYGLAGYVWTVSAERILRVSRRLRVGTVWANTALVRDVRVPFGGYKQSGVGRLGGQYSIQAFTEVKNTCIAITPHKLPALGRGGAS